MKILELITGLFFILFDLGKFLFLISKDGIALFLSSDRENNQFTYWLQIDIDRQVAIC
jgi:hypothetical protein